MIPDVHDVGNVAGRRRATVGFVAICLGYFAIILDGSVLNVAVPVLRTDLHGTMSGAQWVLNAYTLTLAGLLLTVGSLGDRVGLRRLLFTGTVVFTLASAACAAAPDLPVLIAARIVQGLGAAALLPATLALIPHLFPDRADQARATVIWVGIGAGSVALGPLIGGLLIDSFGWRAIFLINLPIGVASAALGRISIAETARHSHPLDRFGQVTAIGALGLVTAAVIHSGQAGWGSPLTLGLLVGGLAVGAVFWIGQHWARHPMLPPEFFGQRVRTVAVACAAMMGFVFYGTLFVMSLYFQQARGWTPGSTGVALLPLTLASLIGPFLLYRPLSRRFGHPVLLVAGFVCCASGIAVLIWTGAGTAYPVLVVGLALVGGASTVSFTALTSMLLGSVSGTRSGLASGVQNTTRQTGALMSVSVLGAVLNTGSIGPRLPVAFGVLAVVVVLAIGVSSLAVATGPAAT